MFKSIREPADYIVGSSIFLMQEIPAQVHCQICEVYGEIATINGIVIKWVKQFNKKCENMHDGGTE